MDNNNDMRKNDIVAVNRNIYFLLVNNMFLNHLCNIVVNVVVKNSFETSVHDICIQWVIGYTTKTIPTHELHQKGCCIKLAYTSAKSKQMR